jgi:C4-type Zn-finger protein
MKVNGSLHLIAGGQILNLRVENLALDPTTPYVGQIWFNSAEGVFKYYDGTEVRIFASGGDVNVLIENLAAVTAGNGASLIGVEDSADYFTGTTVEEVLAEIQANLDAEESARIAADSSILTNLASTTESLGASLVGIADSGGLIAATTVEGALAEIFTLLNTEITNRTNADTAIRDDLASTTLAYGASLVGVQDAANNYTATTVEGALAEIYGNLQTEIANRTSADTAIRDDFASTVVGEGASLVGIQDAAGNFTATTVEGALQEIASSVASNDTALRNDLASTLNGYGASLVGVEDAASNFTATTIEGVLAEVYTNYTNADAGFDSRITVNEGEIDDLEAALGSATGVAGMVYSSNNYIVSGTSAVDALGVLDTGLQSVADLVGSSDLQTAYANSAGNSPDGHARIKLETGKDLRFVDDTDDSVYFMVDSETGDVIITGNLVVTGTSVNVDSTVTEFETQAIKTGLAGTTGLDIRPGEAYTVVGSEALATGDGTTVTFSGNLANTDVKDVVITDSIETFTYDEGSEQLVGSAGGVGTVDLNTGAWSVTFAAAPASSQAISAGYSYLDGYITPTADLVAIRNDAESASAVVRVDSAGQLVTNNLYQANAGINVTGNIDITGTVDGVDVSDFKVLYDAHVNGAASKHDATEIDYEGGAASNYLVGVVTVENAVTTLDSEIKSINDALGGGTGITNRIDGLEAALGTTSGLAGMDYTSVNYVTVDTSAVVAISDLDSSLKTVDDALATEVSNRTSADTAIRNDFASVVSGKGASLVGVEDATGVFTATTVEGVLVEIQENIVAEAAARTAADTDIYTTLASVANGEGASLVGVEDVAGSFTATTVEGVLAELKSQIDSADSGLRTDLASTFNGKGASLVGVEDLDANFTATTVEGVLAEIQDNIDAEAAARTAADTAVVTTLASTANGEGASTVGVEDAAGNFTATTVEGVLTEISNRITNSTYVYTSTEPLTSHVITHNFGQKYCNVTVIDSTDNMVIPQAVVFTTTNSLTVSFNSAIDCTVVCSK